MHGWHTKRHFPRFNRGNDCSGMNLLSSGSRGSTHELHSQMCPPFLFVRSDHDRPLNDTSSFQWIILLAIMLNFFKCFRTSFDRSSYFRSTRIYYVPNIYIYTYFTRVRVQTTPRWIPLFNISIFLNSKRERDYQIYFSFIFFIFPLTLKYVRTCYLVSHFYRW